MRLMSQSLDTLLLMDLLWGCKACLKAKMHQAVEPGAVTQHERTAAMMQFVVHIEMREIDGTYTWSRIRKAAASIPEDNKPKLLCSV